MLFAPGGVNLISLYSPFHLFVNSHDNFQGPVAPIFDADRLAGGGVDDMGVTQIQPPLALSDFSVKEA